MEIPKDSEIRLIKDFVELQNCMDLVREGWVAMNKTYEAFEYTEEEFIKQVINVLGSDDEGIAVAYVDGAPVGYGVGLNNTPPFASKKCFLVYALYVKPSFSKPYREVLFNYAEEFAKEKDYHSITAYNGRFSGASFRLFEQTFGMRRQAIQFRKVIK